MTILWWEKGEIRPNQLLKRLKYLWKNVNMNPVWRKTSVSRIWHVKAIPSSGWEQLLMPVALGSLCSFCPSSLSCRWGFASSRHCEIVLVLRGVVWTPGQHCQQGFLSSPCYTWTLTFSRKLFLLLEYLPRCILLRGQIGEAHLITSRCLPSPLILLSQPRAPLLIRGEKLDFSEPF